MSEDGGVRSKDQDKRKKTLHTRIAVYSRPCHSPQPRRSRRSTKVNNYRQGEDFDEKDENADDEILESEEEDTGEDMEEDLEVDEEVKDERPRRTTSRSRKNPTPEEEPRESRRKSSRSNKFTSSMAEPGKSIRDILPDGVTEFASTPPKRRRRDDTGVGDSLGQAASPHHKSPARRHAQRRRSLKHSQESSDNDDDEEEEEESSVASTKYSSASEDDDELASSPQDEEEDAEPLKMQRILASRTETRQKWKEICRAMQTSEIEYGSRWFQPGDDVDKPNDDEVFEERFLIKWADLSYLHCSWETQEDVLEQLEQSKSYFSTFFRKSHNGLLFSADERCDGDYYDPAFTEIDRILEIQLPEAMSDADLLTVENEDKYTDATFGIIMDKQDPNFEDGTGRQFLIKWCNSSYSDSTYEFERDLILNDIEYKEKVKEFLKRSTKMPKKKKERLLRKGEEEFRKVYKVFGDRSDLDDTKREKTVEKYKRDLQEHVYKNGGQLRDYQAEGVAWMLSNYVNKRSSILGDEMGLVRALVYRWLCVDCRLYDSHRPILSPPSFMNHSGKGMTSVRSWQLVGSV